MNFVEFKSRILKYAKQCDVSIKKIYHDDEKGLNVAILNGLKITGNSYSEKVTIFGQNGRKFIAYLPA